MNEAVLGILTRILTGFGYFFILWVFAINVGCLLLMLFSWRRYRKYISDVRYDPYESLDYNRPVSILLPVHDDEKGVIETVQGLLDLEYPVTEVIVINNGSTDMTLKRLGEHYNLQPLDIPISSNLQTGLIRRVLASLNETNLVVIDQDRSSPEIALNTGIAASRYPLLCPVSPGCRLEKYALLRMATPIHRSEDVVAVMGSGGLWYEQFGDDDHENAGSLKPPRGILQVFQALDSRRRILIHRIAWERLNAMLAFPDSFVMYRKAAVLDVGGFQAALNIDLDMSLRLHRHMRQERIPYEVAYSSEMCGWKPAPKKLRDVRYQRVLWHKGLLQQLWRSKGMMLNPAYGFLGLLTLPYLLVAGAFAPLVDLLGWILTITAFGIGFWPWLYLTVLGASLLFGMFYSVFATFLEEISRYRYDEGKSVVRLVLLAPLEQLCLRPLVMLWKVRAFFPMRTADDVDLRRDRKEKSLLEHGQGENSADSDKAAP